MWLASYFGSENYDQIVWQKVYCIMALFMAVGIFANLTSSEPKVKKNIFKKTNNHLIFFLSVLFAVVVFIYLYSNISFSIEDNNFLVFILTCLKLFFCFLVSGIFLVLMTKLKIVQKKMVSESYIAPVKNFIEKYGRFALIILMLISLYRIADIVMGVMANIFYLEKGYSIKDIATYSKFFGVFATIIGGLLGGYFASKKGTMTALFLGALIASLSNLLFAWLATVDANINYLIMVITADNISSGFAGAAFVIYLSGLTSIKFTATQYALFSSIMLFLPKLIAGYSGAWVDVMGYSNYFILTALLGMPVLFLIYWIGIIAPVKDK